MATKSNRDRNDFSFFSWRGTYGEKMPTPEEVFKRNRHKMIKAQNSIERQLKKNKAID